MLQGSVLRHSDIVIKVATSYSWKKVDNKNWGIEVLLQQQWLFEYYEFEYAEKKEKKEKEVWRCLRAIESEQFSGNQCSYSYFDLINRVDLMTQDITYFHLFKSTMI